MERRGFTGFKKKAKAEQRCLAYEDEAAFYLLPSRHLTYARVGQTPVLKMDAKNKLKVAAAVAISPEGDLYFEVRECSFKSQAMVRFVNNLWATWLDRLLIIWDGASIHTSNIVRDFLSQQADNPRIWLAKIPPYSPQLNPAEQVWNYLKNVLLRNVFCKTVKELKKKVIKAFEIIKQDKDLIKSFFHHHEVGFYT